MGRIGLVAAFMVAWAFQAGATPCNELKRYADPEIREMISLIKDPEADEFDQVAAVEALSCAERKTVRDLAFRAMLRSQNAIVRAEGVFRALADRKVIVVELHTTEAQTREQIEYVRNHPRLVFDNAYADPVERCISLYYNDQCRPSHSIFVTRNEVTLRYPGTVLVLESTPEGLTGELTNREGRFPAEIEVY